MKTVIEINSLNKNICLITCSSSKAFAAPLFNIEQIISSFANLNLILGSTEDIYRHINSPRVRLLNVKHKSSSSIILRIARYIFLQIRISYILTKLAKEVDLVIFFMEDAAFLPVITAKCLNLKSIRMLPSFISLQSIKRNKSAFSHFLVILKRFTYNISDYIVIYSPALLVEWNLTSFAHKVLFAHEHIIDTNLFRCTKEINTRTEIVGYVGRLSEEKGVLDFVKAIPHMIKQMPDIKFLVIGEGPLIDEIESIIIDKNLSNVVNMKGWIPHDDLPSYLNELKLLVIPSYTEGLPNIMLEAMACGTPVLATPVGAISDIIEDGISGFILPDNSSEVITKTVVDVLKCSNLEKISEKSISLVKQRYTYSNTTNNFYNMIKALE